MNIITEETANDSLLNDGDLGMERKLYYRELVARFGHHLGVVWNLGEENKRSPEQLEQDALYIRALDPYQHPVAIRNPISLAAAPVDGASSDPISNTMTPLLGSENFEIASVHMNDSTDVHAEVIKWRTLSRTHRKPWVIYLDEAGDQETGIEADTATTADHRMLMRSSLWGAYMAGGAGTSWYFGPKDQPHNDLAEEDFRTREKWLQISFTAHKFFTDHVPFAGMQNHDELVNNPQAYCLAKEGEIYEDY
jgi:hypothetical protein